MRKTSATSMDSVNFNRIAEAIKILQHTFTEQPSLEELARQIHVSPAHFQKLFTTWAGVSPKKFVQYITVSHAKLMLRNSSTNKIFSSAKPPTLFDTAIVTGLSGTGRLHDLFVNIEGMTPGEYKNGGEGLLVNYSFANSIFGNIIVASTVKGICHISFLDDEKTAIMNLMQSFPHATYIQSKEEIHCKVVGIFNGQNHVAEKINLHIKGTAFQIKVWEALLKIPEAVLGTYADIAGEIDNAKAARAVGSAIGKNPIAYLIPCHRVIQTTGLFGGYMWGSKRKTAMIGWEAVREVMNDGL